MPWREICSVNGLMNTSFRFRYVIDDGDVIASWELPADVLSETDLGLQLLLAGLSGDNQPVLCRVHAFKEGVKWHAALLEVKEDSVDGHMCAIDKGLLCAVTTRQDATGGVAIVLKVPFRRCMSEAHAAIPSIYNRVYGKVYRRVAGVDLPSLAEDLLFSSFEPGGA